MKIPRVAFAGLCQTRWRSWLLLAVACSVPPVADAGRRLGTLEFEPCTLAAAGMPVTVAAQCATLAVPEDRSRPEARRIDLAIAWVPAAARRAAADPVFMLAGGPGQSAREAYPAIAHGFRDVQRQRDIILVDQRGTGGSNPLVCRDESGASSITEDMSMADLDAARRFAEACLSTLDADVRFYTTTEAARDLDDVRRAIGADRINLVGISYGTRLAQEYLRRYPAETRSVVLDGVVPPQLALGSEHAKNLDAALRLQFMQCEADATCSERFGSPWASLQQLLAQLRDSPREVEFRDPLTHATRKAELAPAVVVTVARLFAYSPTLSAMLPMVLADALAGRPETLMSQAQMIEDLLGEQIMHGMQLSVGCSEDADLLQPDPADAATLLGTYFVEFIKTQCEVWPRGQVPPDFHAPLASDRPVLLFSGELDPVTPPRYGDEARRGLSNSRHLVLPGGGHNVLADGCLPQLMARFIETADPAGLDPQCVEEQIRPPPFAGTYGWEP